MNPNDENNNPVTPPPAPITPDPVGTPDAVSAGDEAALKAIEALDAESSQFDPQASAPVEDTPVPVKSPTETPSVEPATSAPSEPLGIPAEPLPTEPVSPEAPQPETPAAPSPLDQVLGDPSAAPLSTPFQPFEAPKKPSSKVRISLIVVLVLLVLGVGGFFGWQYLQSQNTTNPAQNSTPTDQDGEDETPEVTDTETSVNSAVTEMQSDLDDINDAAYQDSTLSDATLFQ